MAEMKESQDEIAQFFLDRGISAEEEEKSVEDELNKLMGERIMTRGIFSENIGSHLLFLYFLI